MSNSISNAAQTGVTFASAGDYQNALVSFDDAIAKAKKDPSWVSSNKKTAAWIHAMRGEILQKLLFNRTQVISDDQATQMLQTAESDFTEATTLDPSFAWAFAHYGELCRNQICRLGITAAERTAYFEKGEQAFRKAVSLNANYAWAYSHYGALLANMRVRYEESLELLHKAKDLFDNENAWVYANQLVCYYQLNSDQKEAGKDTKDYMSRAFCAMFMAISADPDIFNHSLMPARQITEDEEYSTNELFMWALRNYLSTKQLAASKVNKAGALEGFYSGFTPYFRISQDVFSYLADKEENPNRFPTLTLDGIPAEKSGKQSGHDLENTYRTAGLLALAWHIRNENVLKERAIKTLKTVIENVDRNTARGNALIQMMVHDVAFYRFKGEVSIPTI